MAKIPVISLSMILVPIIATVLGCGVMPPGQARTRSFTVSGFKLPVPMVAYTGDGSIPAQAPGIARSKETARVFVERQIVQTVTDVLEKQGRYALLPDTIISSILGQLRIQINYDPLDCKGATVVENLRMNIEGKQNVIPHCIIVGNTVTALCGPGQRDNIPFCRALAFPVMIEAIPANYTSLSGTLTTTNIIMATWSREMWQGVVNKAMQMLAAGPFAAHFAPASATVS
ncbi:hypothetical protein KIN20_000719 [Parelaphostrongylus tenuis]|uniref:Uncharacterized protein n=1 Tax=Parelaphostrongylus tenuis TaxID=148309 RepID=A0AAD5ML20_PARTN|nr:hypothetical protein KIN20_000719 [Parelaphostrongylus tenuis]